MWREEKTKENAFRATFFLESLLMEENGGRWCCVIGMRNEAHEVPPTHHMIRFKKCKNLIWIWRFFFLLYLLYYIYDRMDLEVFSFFYIFYYKT